MALTPEQKTLFWQYIQGENSAEVLKNFLEEIESQSTENLMELWRLKNEHGDYALHVLCQIQQKKQSTQEKIQLLLQYSLDLDLRDRYGRKASDLLSMTEEDKIIKAYFDVYEFRKKIAKEQRLDDSRISMLIQKSLSDISKLKSIESGVLVLGNSRVGKSTLINYLLGVDYTIGYVDDEITAIPGQEERARVGRTENSETSVPTMHHLSESVALIDFPGFDDNRSVNSQDLNPYIVAANVGNFLISKKIKEVKKFLIVFAWDQLNVGNIKNFRDPLLQFLNMIDEKDLTSALDVTQLWVTKSNKTVEACTIESVKRKFERLQRQIISGGAPLASQQTRKLDQFFAYMQEFTERMIVIPIITDAKTKQLFDQQLQLDAHSFSMENLDFAFDTSYLEAFRIFVDTVDQYNYVIGKNYQLHTSSNSAWIERLSQTEGRLREILRDISVESFIDPVKELSKIVDEELIQHKESILSNRDSIKCYEALQGAATFFSADIEKIRACNAEVLPLIGR